MVGALSDTSPFLFPMIKRIEGQEGRGGVRRSRDNSENN